jgi:hypothetical protein
LGLPIIKISSIKAKMIKLLNNFNNYSKSIIKSLVPNFTGMIRVKAGRPLVNHLLKMTKLVTGSITNSLVKVIISYIRNLHKIQRKNGIPFTVNYLKACVTLLMQSLSGEKHESTRPLKVAVSRTNSGLPRIIPRLHRAKIKEGNIGYIRLWLTLFSLYRVFDYVGKLKIDTIIKPSNANVNFDEIKDVVSKLDIASHFSPRLLSNQEPSVSIKPFWISASSPTCIKAVHDDDGKVLQGSSYSTSIYSIVVAIRAFAANPVNPKYLELTNVPKFLKTKVYKKGFSLASAFDNYCSRYGYSGPIRTLLAFSKFAPRYAPGVLSTPKARIHLNYDNHSLGKLSFKIEPAGKIRVFAMVDCFTQWLLKELHDDIFRFLRSLSTDATFDQSKVLRGFVDRLKSENIRKVYSFDLTAATDRIPVSAQVAILNAIENYGVLGEYWRDILVGRWYSLNYPSWDPMAISCKRLGVDPENPYVKVDTIWWRGEKVSIVRAVAYATGQPMGALSSWGMLALTHHIMVQIAAQRVGKELFDLYLVLGDDLVIADKKVAASYLKLAKEWDVGINISKSVISTNGSLEFAKRFFYKYQDVSGLSFKEMAVAFWDIRGLLQLFNRISSFRQIRVSEALSFLGHGYKALSRLSADYSRMSKSMKRALLLFSYPGSLFSQFKTTEEWLTSTAFNRQFKVFDLEESIRYLRDVGLGIKDTVKQSLLPRTPEEFRIMYHKLYVTLHQSVVTFNECGKRIVVDWIKNDFPIKDKKSNDYSFAPLRETLLDALIPMYYNIHEKWDSTMVEVLDTFDMEEEDLSIDDLWSRIEELEDIASLNSTDSDFREIKDVITLGSSILLRRADKIRNTIEKL